MESKFPLLFVSTHWLFFFFSSHLRGGILTLRKLVQSLLKQRGQESSKIWAKPPSGSFIKRWYLWCAILFLFPQLDIDAVMHSFNSHTRLLQFKPFDVPEIIKVISSHCKKWIPMRMFAEKANPFPLISAPWGNILIDEYISFHTVTSQVLRKSTETGYVHWRFMKHPYSYGWAQEEELAWRNSGAVLLWKWTGLYTPLVFRCWLSLGRQPQAKQVPLAEGDSWKGPHLWAVSSQHSQWLGVECLSWVVPHNIYNTHPPLRSFKPNYADVYRYMGCFCL